MESHQPIQDVGEVPRSTRMRYLDVPIMEPIEIDERLTIGRSLFGDWFADKLDQIRAVKFFSTLTFMSLIVAVILGYALLCIESLHVSVSAINSLRLVFRILFPLALFHNLSGFLRLVTGVVLTSIFSFDVLYLSAQTILFGWGWCYMYWDNSTLVMLSLLCMLSTINAIFSDSMNEMSRKHIRSVVLLGAAVIIFSVVVWKLSTDIALRHVVELPFGSWLRSMGYVAHHNSY